MFLVDLIIALPKLPVCPVIPNFKDISLYEYIFN